MSRSAKGHHLNILLLARVFMEFGPLVPEKKIFEGVLSLWA